MTIEKAVELGMYIVDRQEHYGHVDSNYVYIKPGVLLFCDHKKHTYQLGTYNSEEEALKDTHCAYNRMLSVHNGTAFDNLKADLQALYPNYKPTPDDYCENRMWFAWNVPYRQAYPEWRF